MKKTFFITCAAFFLGTFAVEKTLVASPVIQRAQLPSTQQPQVDAPEVKLLNSGAEQKAPLRFKVNPSSVETARVTSKIAVSNFVNGQSSERINTPVTELIIKLQVTKVDESGDTYADFVYSDIKVTQDSNTPSEVLEAVREQTKQMIGLKGSVVFDNRGNVKSYDLPLPDNLEPSLKEYLQSTTRSIKRISNPLPVEPVGIGAQWETTTNFNAGGIDIKQITTYSLLAKKDEEIMLDVVIEQQADPQPINSPKLPSGTTGNLLSHQGQGQGELVLNLNRVMPENAEIQTTSESKIRLTQPGNAEDTIVDSQSTVNFTIETQW